MNNLTYNPNVNIPYHNKYNTNMEYEDEVDTHYNMPQQFEQMDPRVDPRMNSNIEQPAQYRSSKNSNRNYQKYNMMPGKKNNRGKRNYYNSENYENNEQEDYVPTVDKFDNKSKKFDWMLIAKKIVIYTALFLVMSHVKMDELVCKFIPFLSDNQILCMTTKGILLALIIILIQNIL